MLINSQRMADDEERLRTTWESWAHHDRQFAILSADEVRNWDEPRFMSHTWELDFALDLASCHTNLNYGRALDLGCGMGRLTQPLADRFDSVVGLDISSAMIDNAIRLNQRPNCEFMNGTLERLPSAEFDFVISVYVIQHIPTSLQGPTLRGMLRVLKPDGVAVAVIHGGLSPFRRLIRRMGPRRLKEWRWQQQYPNLPMIEMNPLSRRQVESSIAPGRIVMKQKDWYVVAP